MITALACQVFLQLGTHYLICEAEYLHIVRGDRYRHKVETGWITVGPAIATCSGQGRPEKLRLFDLGQEVCVWTMVLFEDGFESGSTAAWISTAQ